MCMVVISNNNWFLVLFFLESISLPFRHTGLLSLLHYKSNLFLSQSLCSCCFLYLCSLSRITFSSSDPLSQCYPHVLWSSCVFVFPDHMLTGALNHPLSLSPSLPPSLPLSTVYSRDSGPSFSVFIILLVALPLEWYVAFSKGWIREGIILRKYWR